MDLIFGGNPLLWLLITIFFMVVEGVCPCAVSLWFAVGAFVTFLLSFFTTSGYLALTCFICVSLVTVFTLRKYALSKFKIGHIKTNVDELIGLEALVVETISFPDGGRIQLKGTTWRCLSDSNTCYEAGAVVSILRIEGVTAYVA